jgi:hypothetical protein
MVVDTRTLNLGLACWECRSADEQKIYVQGANSQAFRTEASTNGRPLEAIRMHEHGSGMSESVVRQIERDGGTIPKSAHQQRVEELRNREIQAKAFIQGHRVSLSKAEEAIHARLDSVLFLAENKVPMSQFKAQVELLNRRGALDRGPLPGQDGSFESLTASYTSVEIADQLVYALAAAIDLWYQPLIKMQKAIGMASDGTSRAKKSHQAIVYKILNLSVPNRKPPPQEYRGCALQLYASVHHMQRDTAVAIFESMKLQWETDGITVKQLTAFAFDTCNVMFGCNNGVIVLLDDLIPWAVSRKCRSHLSALGDKGLEEDPFMQKVVNNMQQLANCADASARYQEILSEANELFGTNTEAISQLAFTRWSSIFRQLKKISKAQDYATTMHAVQRAGKGGEHEHYILSAGSSNATMSGLFYQLTHREQVAGVLVLHDLLEITSKFNLTSQKISFNRSKEKQSFSAMDTKLTDCIDSPAASRPVSFGWEQFCEEMRNPHGIEMKRTGGRNKAWINRMQNRAALTLRQSHRDRNPDDDVADDLLKLFDWRAAPLRLGWPLVSNEVLDNHYKPILDAIAITLSNPEAPWVAPEDMQTEWECARRAYVDLATKLEPELILNVNRKNEADVARRNLLRRKGEPEEFVPSTRLDIEDMLEHILGNYDTFTPYPAVEAAASNLCVSLYSQARVEAVFSHLKDMLRPIRSALLQPKLDMLLYIQQNGPTSRNGVCTGMTNEWVLKTAYKIWCSADIKRKIHATNVLPSDPDLEGLKPYEKFGQSPFSGEAATRINEEIARATAAKERKESVAELDAAAAKDKLAELEEDREALLNGPSSQVNLVKAGRGGPYIQCLEASGVTLRTPVLDIDEKMQPQVGDTVAVTGFGGNIWWTGSVEVVSCKTIRRKKVLIYTVVFEADEKYSDIPLAMKCYGPAKITPARSGGKDTVKAGWMFVRPKAEGAEDDLLEAGDGRDGGGAAASAPKLEEALFELVQSCDCGGAQTVAAMKREQILTLAQLKEVTKKELRGDLNMALGHANNLLLAYAAVQ